MGIVILFLVLIVIVLGSYGVALFMKGKQVQAVSALDEQKVAIFDIPIDDIIIKLKNMHLSGQTKRLSESWQARWDEQVKEVLPNIETRLSDAEQYADQLRFFKSRRAIDEAREMIDEAEKNVFQIDEALQRLVDSEKENHEEIEAVSEHYKTLRNNALKDSVKFKEAFETIDERLSNIEASFQQFDTLMEEADYIEARDVLKQAEKQTIALEEILPMIPAFYNLVDVDFKEQLDDIKQGHARLVEQQFKFKDIDLNKAIETLENLIDSAREDVTALNIGIAKEKKQDIEKEIERLYNVMEQEIDAKEYIQKASVRLNAHLKQISESNRYVTLEIDRISQNYELTDNEEERVAEYKAQLDKEAEALEHYQSLLENHDIVFSTVKEYFIELAETLSRIDNEQATLMKELGDLRQRERYVREQLDMFEVDLRNMKRALEKQYLPGLSKTYLDLFFATTKRIETLSEKLNRIKINMKEIDEHVALCTEDVEQLDEATENIIDNAVLTEQLIQYANRYRMEHAAIEKAINTAINLYQHQYKYAEAKQTVANALSKVEAGAVQRVEKLYQEDKNRRVYL
ncbi:selenide, water dikinase [Granulicatella sp. zg-ZJ]|uniref:septation ring formation regulator EzrA n=1 Tax=unclassified Granulicatella TaxID=2630493 RepID=UPI0013BFF026|nr:MULTISPECIES: septation ring formation regulator EzrA [unclassified Granulicatella]MBS4750181.1 selenide, water dikinase [Carnobacteriaceae bacterium zg-ZUI78]NEW62384.1 selenide, water dikinase [Granulicatella sp. zg-ZJ]NEW66275.1 selenide, water dikinase [Granulicatella sp. zg-84]QMI85637.1 selenide, water dikinase [Carnobacteriaceae bacterium zg-84]